MGKSDVMILIPFTKDHVKNRELIIKMLQFEDEYGKSRDGQNLYRTKLLLPHTLKPIYAIHKHVLNHFGFDTSDLSVKNYRKIFSYYYKSPTEYDKDVLDSVYYMKNNKCVYYQKPTPKIGDKFIDCNLLCIDGTTKIRLFDILKDEKFKYAFIGAFSSS
jgi:hypothetical protein